MLTALITSIAGLMTAGLHFVLALSYSQTQAARWCRFIAAMALSFSMLLAALYGLRSYLQIPWLEIPWMRALHGSANALGFGLAGLIGWNFTHDR
jgi:YndJ-like protein